MNYKGKEIITNLKHLRIHDDWMQYGTQNGLSNKIITHGEREGKPYLI